MTRKVIHILVPAWNEEEKLGETLDSLLSQTRRADRIIVIPNGCTDGTARVARSKRNKRSSKIFVYELPALENRKSEALNMAWKEFSQDADIVITLDADTVLDPDALKRWEREFSRKHKAPKSKPLGGSMAKAIISGDGYWRRMQKAEFARVVDAALIRGTTSVLAGAGTAFSGQALKEVAALGDGREGPWSYESMTEDYEITLQMRKLGWHCTTSEHVRMYTDGMPNLKSLWGQRMKWSTGQLHELVNHGLTRYTYREWGSYAITGLLLVAQAFWLWILSSYIASGTFTFNWLWWIAYPVIFIAAEIFFASRMALVDKKDYLYAMTLVPFMLFRVVGIVWLMWSTISVARERLTGRYVDRWERQSIAEQ